MRLSDQVPQNYSGDDAHICGYSLISLRSTNAASLVCTDLSVEVSPDFQDHGN